MLIGYGRRLRHACRSVAAMDMRLRRGECPYRLVSYLSVGSVLSVRDPFAFELLLTPL